MLSRLVWTRRLLRPRTLPQAPFRTFSSLGITPTLEHAADALRVRRTSLARDARFARLLDNFSSVDAVRDVRAISPSSPERLFAMPIVPELGLPKDTSSGNREFFHVQLSDSRLDAVEHVVRASLEDESPGSVFSGAQGTGKSMLGFMLATHGFLKGWPTVYIPKVGEWLSAPDPHRFWLEAFLRQNADLVYDDGALSTLRPQLEEYYVARDQYYRVLPLFADVHSALAAHANPVRFIYDEHQVLWAHGAPLSSKPNSAEKEEFFRLLRTWTGRDAEGVTKALVYIGSAHSAFLEDMPSGSNELRKEIAPLLREEMELALTADDSDLKIKRPDHMGEEQFFDMMERKTGGLARVLTRVAKRVSSGVDVQKAVDNVCHHEQAGHLRALRSVHSKLDDTGKKEMLATAKELASLFESNTAYPGVFHDGGMTTVNLAESNCRVINEPGFLALVDFLRTSDRSWQPIDLADPNAGTLFEEQFVDALVRQQSPVDYRDTDLRVRMGRGFDVMTGLSDPPSEDHRVVLWLKEKRTFPPIDAVLYNRVNGMPTNAVFLQCSIQDAPDHAKKSPSRAVLRANVADAEDTGLSDSTQQSLKNALAKHFSGEHDVQVEGDSGDRRLVWRYTPEGSSDAQAISVWYVYATTAMPSVQQRKAWQERAVKNASFLTRETCVKKLGLVVLDRPGDN